VELMEDEGDAGVLAEWRDALAAAGTKEPNP